MKMVDKVLTLNHFKFRYIKCKRKTFYTKLSQLASNYDMKWNAVK